MWYQHAVGHGLLISAGLLPLGALSYRTSSRRERLLAAQAAYDGAKWALTLPAICGEIIVLSSRGRLVWALMFLARRYATLALMLRSLPEFSDYGLDAPPTRKLAAAVALYPIAIFSYGAGGLGGALTMLSEWITGKPRIQPRTEG